MQAFESVDASNLRAVTSLLWPNVEFYLPAVEIQEVRSIVGARLIEENALILEETQALSDMLGEVRLHNEAVASRQELCNNPKKMLLEGEVRQLLEKLKHMATCSPAGNTTIAERDPLACVPKASVKDEKVLHYLSSQASGGLSSRPGTSSTRTSSRPSTARSSGGGSVSSHQDALLQAVNPNLSIFNIDEAKATLRAALEEENRLLLTDVEYLQSLLKEETDLQAVAGVSPSEAELKEYKHKLDEAFWKEEQRVKHEQHAQSLAAASAMGKSGRLQSLVNGSWDITELLSPATTISRSNSLAMSKSNPAPEAANVTAHTISTDPQTWQGLAATAPPTTSLTLSGTRSSLSIPLPSLSNSRDRGAAATTSAGLKSTTSAVDGPAAQANCRANQDRGTATWERGVGNGRATQAGGTAQNSIHSQQQHRQPLEQDPAGKQLNPSDSRAGTLEQSANATPTGLSPTISTGCNDAVPSSQKATNSKHRARSKTGATENTAPRTATRRQAALNYNYPDLEWERESVQGRVVAILRRNSEGLPDRMKASLLLRALGSAAGVPTSQC